MKIKITVFILCKIASTTCGLRYRDVYIISAVVRLKLININASSSV